MSAKIKPLGVLAGEGALPRHLIRYCIENAIPVVAIRFHGCSYNEWRFDIPTCDTRIEKVGEIFSFFRKHHVQDVVMIGNLSRPSLSSLRPDWRGIKTLGRIAGAFAKGDDNLLRTLRQEIENEGYTVRGLDYYLKDLTAPAGTLTALHRNKPKLIEPAIAEAIRHGQDDKGQSILVHEDGSYAYEDIEGTSKLIQKHGKNGSILVKMMKPQQDPDLDRPTVGLNTLRDLHVKGCAGMVIQAEAVYMVDRQAMIEYANQNGLFIEAVDA